MIEKFRKKGVFHRGQRRIYFFDLFSYQKARGAIARIDFAEIVFEEAIPIDQEFLNVRGRTEQWIFHDLIDSLKGRKGKDGQPIFTKITFLANPYSWSSWFLDTFQNLFNYKKEAEEKVLKNDNSGVLEVVKNEEGVEWLLYLNLIEGEEDPHSRSLQEKINPFLVNWDNFMISLYTKTGNLKKYQIEHAIQDFFFCEIGEREVNKKYILMHFSKNKKEVDQNTVNFCFNLEEKAKSKLKECVIRDQKKLISNWVDMLKEGELFFSDFRARDWFLEQIKAVLKYLFPTFFTSPSSKPLGKIRLYRFILILFPTFLVFTNFTKLAKISLKSLKNNSEIKNPWGIRENKRWKALKNPSKIT